MADKAFKKLLECDADFVVANDLGRKGAGAGSDMNEVLVVDKKKQVIRLPLDSKAAIARKLLEIVAARSAGR